MTATKRPCRVVSCGNNLRPGLLMCPSCWRTVPREMRKAWRASFRLGAAVFKTETDKLLAHAASARSPLL